MQLNRGRRTFITSGFVHSEGRIWIGIIQSLLQYSVSRHHYSPDHPHGTANDKTFSVALIIYWVDFRVILLIFYFSLQHIPFKMSKFFIREINVSQLIYIQYFWTQKVVYIADICHCLSCQPCLNFCTQQQ